MRRFREICLVLALFGLAGSARAQYYPQPSYNPYAQPAPYYYGYSPNQPSPRYLPGYYGTPRPADAPAVEAAPVKQAQQAGQQLPPASEIPEAPPQPEPLPSGGPPIAPSPRGAGLPPVRYTIPEVLASFPYESPKPSSAIWGKAEYLIWWVRNGTPRFPLVTTDSNPGQLTSGSLQSPTVSTLFGNDGFDYGAFNGGRLTVGLWLDSEERFGVEASGFVQETRSVRFHAGSDTNPALYLPAYNILLGTESRLIIADPTIPLTGTVDIASTLQLWGYEVNGVYRLTRFSGWDVQLLGGFRYLDLLENFELENTTSGFNQTAYLLDHFQSRNQFYGPQAGVRGDYTFGRFTAGLSAKIALGVTHEVNETAGSNVAANTGATAGGFFSQSTNIGRGMVNMFSAVPQFTASLGYNVSEHVMIFAGYDYLLWTGVARAGDQIDRVLNLSQSAAFSNGTLTSPLQRPEPLFHHADFWAQGVSLGVQFRY
jgi:hypothetical protein